MRTMHVPARGCLAALLLLLIGAPARAADERLFKPTPGYLPARDLPDGFAARVRSIRIDVKDALEGSASHTEAEDWVFEWGNRLHIESRQGTISRRVHFREGDTVTKSLLMETEHNLRSEEFLADAVAEVRPGPGGEVDVKLTTYDQWSLAPGTSLNRLGGEWIYWLGLVESNVLGTGQRLGFFYGHDQFRNTLWADYNNNALTNYKLRLSANAGKLSDGFKYALSLSRPLESRSHRWAFKLSAGGQEVSERYYWDANDYEALAAEGTAGEDLGRKFADEGRILLNFDTVATYEASLGVTRSFGYRTKLNFSLSFDFKDRYNKGPVRPRSDSLAEARPLPPSAFEVNERTDYLPGFEVSVYRYDYKTVRNYRNLKWNETLSVGWRLTNKVSRNLEFLGARNDDFRLSHTLVFNNAWNNRHFVNSSAGLAYFVSGDGKFDDGYASAYLGYQWKPVPLLASIFTGTWENYFAVEKSQQLLLGEDYGLNGYPNQYFAGHARLFLEAEQRLFPRFEFGTVVPAFAVFLNAGNTYDTWGAFDPENLHYSVGLGLRLGATKSVQKIVNHLNLSWPLGEKHLGGPRFSIRAKTTL